MSCRVLTIEDEPAIRKSFVAYLEDYDYEVLEAGDGEAGIELLEAELPEVVLVDLRMPKVDGLEVLEYVRTQHPTIPVVVISGTGNIEDVIDALKLGAWDYILKPVEDLGILGYAVERAHKKSLLEKENARYQADLEEQVRDKTVELEDANSRLAKLNSRLKEVVQTVTRLSALRSPEDFAAAVLENFKRSLSAIGGAIYLEDDGGLKLLASLESGELPEFIPHPIKENDIFPGCMQKYSGTDRSCLLFPIPGQESSGPMGVITIQSRTEEDSIEEDKEIGTLLAAFCAEGLRATISFEQIQRHEESLKASLDEKSVLLRELHHRVKNNMQIIMSLLNLQRPSYRDEVDGRLMEKSISRVHSMSMVHDHLYRAENLTQVDLQSYFEGMVGEILKTSSKWHSGIKITIEVDEIALDLERAVPVGLIVHELIDNALDHAFEGKGEGTIEIEGVFADMEGCELRIRDNGIGMDESIDPSTAESLGFLLVQTLVTQLRGTIEFRCEGGVEAVLSFPVEKENE